MHVRVRPDACDKYNREQQWLLAASRRAGTMTVSSPIHGEKRDGDFGRHVVLATSRASPEYDLWDGEDHLKWASCMVVKYLRRRSVECTSSPPLSAYIQRMRSECARASVGATIAVECAHPSGERAQRTARAQNKGRYDRTEPIVHRQRRRPTQPKRLAAIAAWATAGQAAGATPLAGRRGGGGMGGQKEKVPPLKLRTESVPAECPK